MVPDYTHWHGTYEIAKHFYVKYIPELKHLIREGERSKDEQKVAAARALKKKLDELLNSPNHQWFLGRMSAEEKALRAKQREEFQKRYKK